MTDYQRTLEWLYALEAAKGMDFKLERVALALQRLGDPQRQFPSLHVAGTNGKGSVAAMLHAMLGAGGYCTGLYTSPHLVDLTERIRVGGAAIARDQVVALAAEIRAATSARGIDSTFFELVTVMAFMHFARCGVEVAVIEVGLGGRLDATNVVDPAVAVITTIGLDHTEWLGDSLAAIAAEKGGIIKPGRPVVLGRVAAEAVAVLRAIAAERGAPVIEADRDYRFAPDGAQGTAIAEVRRTGEVGAGRFPPPNVALPDGGATLPTGSGSWSLSTQALHAFEGLGWRVDGLAVGLLGAHQRDNAATALATLAALRGQFPVAADAVRGALALVRWPGRLDVVAAEPLTILDGAHNRDGVAALVRELPGLLAGRPLHLLFAVMGDKQWQPMVEQLGPLCASAVVTEVLPPRGAAAALLGRAFEPYCPVVIEPDVVRAWQLVTARALSGEAIVATGSLFLVGALYATVLPAALRGGDPSEALHP